MNHRTASLLSSLAVAVLALTLGASVWRAQIASPSRAPKLVPDTSTCGCAPALRPGLAPECVA